MDCKIKIITPPDVIFDQAVNIAVICPGIDVKKSLETYLTNTNDNINVYLYNNEGDVKWLLSQCKMADIVIVDIDNCDETTSHFLSYILSLPNTYYKVQHAKVPWTLLNKNIFYDFPEILEETKTNEG